jgi:hypothetical protein
VYGSSDANPLPECRPCTPLPLDGPILLEFVEPASYLGSDIPSAPPVDPVSENFGSSLADVALPPRIDSSRSNLLAQNRFFILLFLLCSLFIGCGLFFDHGLPDNEHENENYSPILGTKMKMNHSPLVGDFP